MRSSKNQTMADRRSVLGEFLLTWSFYAESNVSFDSRFESWNASPEVTPGEPAYYQKQVYKHGTRCWNGPERNTVVRAAH